MRVLDMGRGKAPGRKDQQPIPRIAHARARREQIDDLVLAEDVFFEALRDRQHAARAAAFVVASAARDFGAENPGAPLRLRAGVESEDGVMVAGGDIGSDGARRREMVRDVIVRAADVEADVSAGPIVVRRWKRRWRLEWQVRRRCRPCDQRRQRHACKKKIFHDGPPQAGCRRLSIALPRRFGCNLSATRNVIRASGRAIPELRLCSRVSAA